MTNRSAQRPRGPKAPPRTPGMLPERRVRRCGAAALLPALLLAAGATAIGGSDYPRDHRSPAALGTRAGLEDGDTLITFRTTTANNMALTFFNTGFLGSNMSSRQLASLEYPDGSAQEHLVRAGLWVGGLVSRTGEIADAESLVSTVTIDGYYGSSAQDALSEFFPASSEIEELSILPNSRYFDPIHAKSEQDLICRYIDRHNHAGDRHKPLDISVTQEILQFSFEPFDAVLILNYAITNVHPENLLFDVYAGVYTEFASGWKDGYDEWPPSGWFYKKDIAYVDSLRLLTEHHYLLDGGNCPSWIGCQLLGTRPIPIDSMRVSMNWWQWDPTGSNPATPDQDWERYALMSNGSTDPTGGSEAPRVDPVTLLSVGPMGTASFEDSSGVTHWFLEPGDTVTVSFAFVGGLPSPDAEPPRNAQQDIAYNAQWAQTAFDLNFNIPVPPPSPSLFIEAYHRRMRLWWDDLPLGFIDPKSRTQDFEGFRVYASDFTKTEGFALLGEFDLVDSLQFDTGLDDILAPEPLVRVQASGDTLVYPYRYDIRDVRDGFKYWVSVTSFDTGSIDIDPLESGIPQNRQFVIPGARSEETPGGQVIVFPNPYRGDAAWDEELVRDRYLWFAGLPARCTIRIYSLAGDHVQTLQFDADTYGATDVRGIYDPTDVRNPAGDIPVLSGNMAAWDLTTRKDQAIASGLYLFSVEDLDTGEIHRGKFLIMK